MKYPVYILMFLLMVIGAQALRFYPHTQFYTYPDVCYLVNQTLYPSVVELNSTAINLDGDICNYKAVNESMTYYNIRYNGTNYICTLNYGLPSYIPPYISWELNTLENIFVLGILIMLYIGLLALGFIFRNFVLISFAFFIGLIIGFMLFNLGFILTMVFFIFNVLIMLYAGKNR
jgi:hypothetical protein